MDRKALKVAITKRSDALLYSHLFDNNIYDLSKWELSDIIK